MIGKEVLEKKEKMKLHIHSFNKNFETYYSRNILAEGGSGMTIVWLGRDVKQNDKVSI